MTDDAPLRLAWRRSRPNDRTDFICHSPDADMNGQVGRIHTTFGPLGGERWFWTCYGTIGGGRLVHHTSGHAETKAEAARRVEAVWFEWVEEAARQGRVRLHDGNRDQWADLARRIG